MKETLRVILVSLCVLSVPVGAIGGLMWGLPHYKVFSYEMAGKAILAKSENERQVLVKKAQAELDAAAKQAEAIEIVGAAYEKYPEYRNALFMESLGEALENGNIEQIVYLPTEAGIPITEAGKR